MPWSVSITAWEGGALGPQQLNSYVIVIAGHKHHQTDQLARLVSRTPTTTTSRHAARVCQGASRSQAGEAQPEAVINPPDPRRSSARLQPAGGARSPLREAFSRLTPGQHIRFHDRRWGRA